MITRHWTGRVKPEEAQNYINYLQKEILPHLRNLDGFTGAGINRRSLENGIEFLFVSNWASLEHIRAFAGENIEVAVVAEKAQKMMLDFDKEVRHYEVLE
ncbi:antibiotic biosynthesis monooxygenase [Zunongwangia sp. F363]|uniref:Antibiotic biosynthesis monooxygenase n=1 Tax=Autumnicola tepida TaxID=3075595 RepID=A0ABU3CCN7_9FLAO|nr:antibiotic biosynthesis monooxygenase [Zunongwangia sp. F363]MDT0644099.1 antibiotic biosynthesis monooxygenase [Zunongwangia sp. F363]